VSDALPVVWLEDRQAREDAGRALGEWARARGVRLGVLEESTQPMAVDLSLAGRVEEQIERAREAIGAADADAAERALARGETVLREHPELPQAAWLRAEIERSWSARWLRLSPRDETRARTAWENAQAVDGGRVPGIGETSFPSRPRVKTAIIVAGGPHPRLSLRLDGAPIESTESDARGAVYHVEIAPAEHHLLATAGGRVVFAGWVAIAGAEPTPTRISVSDGLTCGRDALAGVRREDGRIDATGVTCPRWIAAVPGERLGTVLVARCEQDACGPLLEWRIERYGASGPPQSHGKIAGWPSWATWTLVGIGAATATTMALIATGVFEARPVETRFVVGGARQE
jgi:hypothetical protein